MDAEAIGAGLLAAAAVRKVKKGKKTAASSASSSESSTSSSTSSSSSSSSSDSTSDTASQATGSEFTKESIVGAAVPIPIRAHGTSPYHTTHHHSDNFHSNHVHLDSFPEVETPRVAASDFNKREFSYGSAFVAESTAPYAEPKPKGRQPIYYTKEPRVNEATFQLPSQIDLNIKTTKISKRKMGRSRSENHHHHLEHIGRVADNVLHPTNLYQRSLRAKSVAGAEFEGARVSGAYYSSSAPREAPEPAVSTGAASASQSTYTIPCHHIRIGDLVILQQRPCQVIRITTSAQTGQHRYLGVDLFTKQLHEEPCVVTHPSPSVVLHSMLTPGFKQYKLLDISESGNLVCMTEGGDIKQSLKIVDQGQLFEKLKGAYGDGTGSIRVLVINDRGNELAVDYKIVHLGQKL